MEDQEADQVARGCARVSRRLWGRVRALRVVALALLALCGAQLRAGAGSVEPGAARASGGRAREASGSGAQPVAVVRADYPAAGRAAQLGVGRGGSELALALAPQRRLHVSR